ncbi:sensor histidine kinase [Solidesulfovibrio alcoholivorans]|uniref:sensor histidine kinase n=1 Tax=Solidesulfovibrio alcoholivorans TaxID=81406 RepID=UPI0012EBEAB4|nr:PAS domain-containing protein [Solidesulfovibrio alcoholivorans]
MSTTASPAPRPFPLRQAALLIAVATLLYVILGMLLLAAKGNAKRFRDDLMEAGARIDDIRLVSEKMHAQALLAAATGEQIFAARHAESVQALPRWIEELARLERHSRVPVQATALDRRLQAVAATQRKALDAAVQGDLPDAWAQLRSLGYENAQAALRHCLDDCDAAVSRRADEALARQGRYTRIALWCLALFTPLFACAGALFVRRARRDAAASVAAQAALADSERRFRDTFELAAVGIAHVSLDGRFLRVNERFCAITGYSADELTQTGFAAITHPEDIESDMELVHRLLAGEIDTFSREKRYLRKDGNTVWVTITVSLARDADGRKLHFIPVIEDISARKAAEAAAHESAATLAALLDATTDRVILADATGTVLAVNKASAESLGRAASDMVGRNFTELFGDALAASRLMRLRRAITAGRILRFTDERDGVVLDNIVAPLPGREGAPGRGALFARDATALVRAREEAEAANQAKSRFLANLSHELRTPLNGIFGMAQVMAGLNPDDAQRQCLDDIASASATLLALIDNLIELSLLETGQTTCEPDLFALADILEAVAATLAPQAAEKHLSFATTLAPDVPPLVRGDGGKLRRILHILGDNAVKFTQQGGVTMVLRCCDACPAEESTVPTVTLACVVADTGIGIPPEEQTRIFDSFTQADGSATRRFGGSGLGLAIARRLARLLCGDITVESRPGQGSVFTLTVLLERPSPAAGDGPGQ